METISNSLVYFKRNVFKFYLLALIIAPAVLFILPSDYFDKGQSVCLSILFFNQECYGCGMTKAIQHLIHLEFDIAYGFNRLSFIVLPLLIYLWAKEIFRVYRIIWLRNS